VEPKEEEDSQLWCWSSSYHVLLLLVKERSEEKARTFIVEMLTSSSPT
jgi:hypothetical protein